MKDRSVQCELCGQWFSIKGIGTHRWRMHGAGINFNPNAGYVSGTREAWNKGLTKETNESLCRMSNSLKRPQTPLEQSINDDGKLKRRYTNKRVNAKKENIDFNLSYEEYMDLVNEAGLKSSQLGFTGEGYVLGRNNDSGPYEKGNCRFITQKENSDEKMKRLYPDKYKDKNDK